MRAAVNRKFTWSRPGTAPPGPAHSTLYVENSDLEVKVKEEIRAGICKQLGQTWQGKRADSAFIQSLHKFDNDRIGKFDTADRLAHVCGLLSEVIAR